MYVLFFSFSILEKKKKLNLKRNFTYFLHKQKKKKKQQRNDHNFTILKTVDLRTRYRMCSFGLLLKIIKKQKI